VDVFAGQPYPVLDEGVNLIEVPSLDLYRDPDPFRMPRRNEYRDWIDVLEVAAMMTAGFPEPVTFSLRARRLMRALRERYDIVHDNQCLGYGMLGLGLPLVTTFHHPIQIDRALDLDHAQGWRRLSLRRWYGFTTMQRRVARRLRHVVTVSSSSRDEIVEHLGVPAGRIDVIPIGTDPVRFSPCSTVERVPGRVVTTASADTPLKGLLYLVEAVAKLRTERQLELVVVGSARPGGPVAEAIERYSLQGAVRFTGRVSDEDLVHQLRSAEVAVVPSLFEGFSLPLVEAMACATPVIATTGGALPEVAGEAALLVPPGDSEALAASLASTLDNPGERARLGAAGRARVLERFTWQAAAVQTAEVYRRAIAAC
jgi:glycosyltransferase involved in cell wall biosynthesis